MHLCEQEAPLNSIAKPIPEEREAALASCRLTDRVPPNRRVEARRGRSSTTG